MMGKRNQKQPRNSNETWKKENLDWSKRKMVPASGVGRAWQTPANGLTTRIGRSLGQCGALAHSAYPTRKPVSPHLDLKKIGASF